MIAFHDQSNLRLEVEVPTTGLPNLVKNPSGEKGAWFWQTPTANTTMTTEYFSGSSTQLRFATTVSQACNFTTDFMPLAATKWVAARIDFGTGASAGHNLKVTFDFYNAAKTFLSSSAQSVGLSGVGTVKYVPEAQAPANTTYVKARFNFFNGAVTNPDANAYITLKRVMVTWQSTSGITSTRTNLVENPSFEVNTAGWSAWGGAPITTTTAQAYVGTKSLAMTLSNAGYDHSVFMDDGVNGIPVVGGRNYGYGFRSRAATVGRTVEHCVSWYDSFGAEILTTYGFPLTNNTTSWAQSTRQVTAPSNAAFASVLIKWVGTAVGETHYLDAVIFEENGSGGQYFDGDTPDAGGIDYAWSGTAHASTSTATATSAAFAYSEPQGWRNIIGPTFEMGIARSALNVGTLTALVSDPLLDPAETDDVRPGRQVRVQALVDGAWSSVYEGKLTTAEVTYEKDLTPGAAEKTIISLTAVDNIATLANRGESRGVATVAALPYLLEDKGVPWNCNGSGGQVTSATQVSSNDNASMLDQVAITRDSVLGHAWVDRKNTLQVWDGSRLTTNFIPNGTFEVDASGWTPSATLTRTTSQFHSGVASGQLTSTGAGDISLKPFPDQPGYVVGPNVQISFEVWVKSATASRSVKMRVDQQAADGSTTSITSGSLGNTSTTGWTKFTHTITTTATTETVMPTLLIVSAAAAGEVHYVDDFFLSSVAVTYTDVPSTAGNFNSYSAIDADFNTDRCINEVNVKWLRYNSTSGETEEIGYGPYKDQTSIDTWGPFSAEFTIHGTNESVVASFANSVLAANSVPKRRANSITVPVRDARTLRHAVLVDLYSLVTVVYSTKINDSYRVTGITHSITSDKWLTTYTFDVTGSVASPTMTPSVANDAATEGVWIAPTLQSGWGNYGGQWETAGYMRKNGIVYLKGLISGGTTSAGTVFFTLPAGFRPAKDKHFIALSADAAKTLQVWADGSVKVGAPGVTATWVSLANLSFPADQ